MKFVLWDSAHCWSCSNLSTCNDIFYLWLVMMCMLHPFWDYVFFFFFLPKSNLHSSSQTGVHCLIWQLNQHVFFTTVHLYWNSLFSIASIALCSHWELTTRRPCLKGLSDCRSRFWRGWVGGLMGHSSGITSTIAKWKPFLEGGNKELSVWAAPFGQGEILSAATAPPPTCLLGLLQQ